jgi:hypothetical protein
MSIISATLLRIARILLFWTTGAMLMAIKTYASKAGYFIQTEPSATNN